MSPASPQRRLETNQYLIMSRRGPHHDRPPPWRGIRPTTSCRSVVFAVPAPAPVHHHAQRHFSHQPPGMKHPVVVVLAVEPGDQHQAQAHQREPAERRHGLQAIRRLIGAWRGGGHVLSTCRAGSVPAPDARQENEHVDRGQAHHQPPAIVPVGGVEVNPNYWRQIAQQQEGYEEAQGSADTPENAEHLLWPIRRPIGAWRGGGCVLGLNLGRTAMPLNPVSNDEQRYYRGEESARDYVSRNRERQIVRVRNHDYAVENGPPDKVEPDADNCDPSEAGWLAGHGWLLLIRWRVAWWGSRSGLRRFRSAQEHDQNQDVYQKESANPCRGSRVGINHDHSEVAKGRDADENPKHNVFPRGYGWPMWSRPSNRRLNDPRNPGHGYDSRGPSPADEWHGHGNTDGGQHQTAHQPEKATIVVVRPMSERARDQKASHVRCYSHRLAAGRRSLQRHVHEYPCKEVVERQPTAVPGEHCALLQVHCPSASWR